MLQLDTEKVIAEVAKWSCLWDNTVRNFRIRKWKLKAWEEVTRAVIDNYEDMNDEERFGMIDRVQQRWKNIRVCYMKERMKIRKNTGKNDVPKKSYLFYDQLRFMDKLAVESETGNDNTENDESVESSNPLPKIVKIESDSDVHQTSSSDPVENGAKKRKRDDTEEEFNLHEMVNETWQKINDSDFSFFNSIIPMVRELDNDSKLLFRSRMIQELMNLRNRKKKSDSNDVSPSFSADFDYSNVVIKSE